MGEVPVFYFPICNILVVFIFHIEHSVKNTLIGTAEQNLKHEKKLADWREMVYNGSEKYVIKKSGRQ